jgi:hypothetical protein
VQIQNVARHGLSVDRESAVRPDRLALGCTRGEIAVIGGDPFIVQSIG